MQQKQSINKLVLFLRWTGFLVLHKTTNQSPLEGTLDQNGIYKALFLFKKYPYSGAVTSEPVSEDLFGNIYNNWDYNYIAVNKTEGILIFSNRYSSPSVISSSYSSMVVLDRYKQQLKS